MKFTIPYLTAVLFSRVEGKAEGRIVNGQAGDIGKAKYLVRITAAGQLCGGALISKGAVLTAAHCTTTTEASQYDIREGKNTQQEMDQSTKLTALSVHPHESYSQTTYNADIAVIVVDNSHPLTVFLSLDTSGMAKEGTSLHLDGWGLTQVGGTVSSLNQLDHKVVGYSECGDAASFQDSLFCASAERQGSTACMGDSGSPLVSENTVVGVVSHGDAGCSKTPTSFTKVSNYVQWINRNSNSGNNQTSSEANKKQQPGSNQPNQNQQPGSNRPNQNQQTGGEQSNQNQQPDSNQPNQNQQPGSQYQPSGSGQPNQNRQPGGEQPNQNQQPSAQYQPSRSGQPNQNRQPGAQYQPSRSGQPNQNRQPDAQYQPSRSGQTNQNRQPGAQYQPSRSVQPNQNRQSGVHYQPSRRGHPIQIQQPGVHYQSSSGGQFI
ncbi:hypothetical protein DSO57_1004870 [Entomophthora muscae]|uniref:Uncharacterized protein n=1 Tax=Entomophthora muscae TaxID=34485 RepID=A0ACC2RZ05_9FUNG|nr:hypothetical protein DSO57_1004870 [Entomophthora muscae]